MRLLGAILNAIVNAALSATAICWAPTRMILTLVLLTFDVEEGPD
jgi:hypothetical protein